MCKLSEDQVKKLMADKTAAIERLEGEKRELAEALASERSRRELAERYHDEAEAELVAAKAELVAKVSELEGALDETEEHCEMALAGAGL